MCGTDKSKIIVKLKGFTTSYTTILVLLHKLEVLKSDNFNKIAIFTIQKKKKKTFLWPFLNIVLLYLGQGGAASDSPPDCQSDKSSF